MGEHTQACMNESQSRCSHLLVPCLSLHGSCVCGGMPFGVSVNIGDFIDFAYIKR